MTNYPSSNLFAGENVTEISRSIFLEVETIASAYNSSTDSILQIINKHLKIYPNSYYLIGMKTYCLASEYSKTEDKEFESFMDKYNDCTNNTFIKLAQSTLKMNNTDSFYVGVDFLKQSIELDTSGINRWSRMELYHYYVGINDIENAEKYLLDCLNLYPDYIYANIQHVYLLIAQGSFDKALTLSRKLMEKYDSFELYALMGNIMLNRSDFVSARKYFNKSIELQSNAMANLGLGDIECIYQEVCDSKKAVKYYLKAIEDEESSYVPYQKLAYLYFDFSEWKLADYYYNESLKRGNEIVADYLSMIYLKLVIGEYAEGLDLVELTRTKFGNQKDISYFEMILKSVSNENKKIDRLLYDKYVEQFQPNITQLRGDITAWGIIF